MARPTRGLDQDRLLLSVVCCMLYVVRYYILHRSRTSRGGRLFVLQYTEGHRASLLVDHAAMPKGKGVYASSARQKNRKGISKGLCHNSPASLNKGSRGLEAPMAQGGRIRLFWRLFFVHRMVCLLFIGRPCGGGFLPCRFLEPGLPTFTRARHPQFGRGVTGNSNVLED
jgi:hypothetical protein